MRSRSTTAGEEPRLTATRESPCSKKDPAQPRKKTKAEYPQSLPRRASTLGCLGHCLMSLVLPSMSCYLAP